MYGGRRYAAQGAHHGLLFERDLSMMGHGKETNHPAGPGPSCEPRATLALRALAVVFDRGGADYGADYDHGVPHLCVFEVY